MKDLRAKQWRINKEGTGYGCDAECDSWDLGICTCGLIKHVSSGGIVPYWAKELWDRHTTRICELREGALNDRTVPPR